MKNLIFSLLCLFLIGSFSGVCHGKTNESKKTEIVKYEVASIDYAFEAPQNIVFTPFVIGTMKYKEAESVNLSTVTKLFYQVFKPDKNSRHSIYTKVNRYWKTDKNKNLKLCSGYCNYRFVIKLC